MSADLVQLRARDTRTAVLDRRAPSRRRGSSTRRIFSPRRRASAPTQAHGEEVLPGRSGSTDSDHPRRAGSPVTMVGSSRFVEASSSRRLQRVLGEDVDAVFQISGRCPAGSASPVPWIDLGHDSGGPASAAEASDRRVLLRADGISIPSGSSVGTSCRKVTSAMT